MVPEIQAPIHETMLWHCMEKMMNYESVTLLAPNNNKQFIFDTLRDTGIIVKAFDYDPKFKNHSLIQCKDFIFDDVDITSDLVVHFNVEKTAPLDYSGEVILIGDDEKHSGDCFPINSVDQMIETYNIKDLYDYGHMQCKLGKQITHHFVYGRM